MHQKSWVTAAALLLILLGALRIVASYKDRAPGFDEAGHTAAGVELLDKHTYTIDRMHPTLGRAAIGLPLYLAGEHYPNLAADDPDSSSYDLVGNLILSGDGHYRRNLALARLGVLPFFIVAGAVVFFWTRREFGNLAAITAVLLFTTLPNVLAFSGLAYTDMAAAGMLCLCFFAFSIWIEKPTRGITMLLGAVTGLAFLSKFTSLMFVPAAMAAMVGSKWFLTRRDSAERLPQHWIRKSAVVAVMAIIIIWGGYGFSVGHVQEDMRVSPASMPSFQHFPAPLRSTARRAVIDNFLVPAPALLRGVADAWALSQTPLDSYLLGHIKSGGWWYFFLVGIAVKSPIPFLLLFLIGIVVSFRQARHGRWQAFAPMACIVALLLVTMRVKYDAGVRHVLPVFPLMAIVAGTACAYLWRLRVRRAPVGAALVGVLLLCQSASSFSARHDYLSYFNDLAGSDPSRVLVLGCDIDCGQDLYRLANELHARGISDVKLAVWTSADPSKLGFPKFETLPPFQPTNGWIAISIRALRFGDVMRQSDPHDAFAWLQRYQPVARIGNTISLYHVTDVSEQ